MKKPLKAANVVPPVGGGFDSPERRANNHGEKSMSGIILAFMNHDARALMARGLIASFLGMFVMACSGCGGGGGDGTPATTQTAATPKPVLIEAYGDSTTEGYSVMNGVSGINPQNQIVVLQQLLRDRFGSNVSVANNGVGGTEASQLLNGTDGTHAPWAQVMAQSKAQIVTIEFGLNDTFFFSQPRAGVESESPDQFEEILTELVNVARAAGKQVVLIEPGPSCNPYRQPTLSYYVMRVDNVAKTLGVPLVPHYWPIIAKPNWQELLSDCTHPTTELYSIQAKSTFDVIEPIVADLINPAAHK
ncbi:SGNH/GDSL hydrolase family protein [Burkholderia multivorans]|uniref:SGNH/GDSL hydrolase family protein n=1 Tax=Burkholderia multivorans TaxID=87883 RepID=UPI001C21217A|nr:SGNH/GDSL hydrolase family protein [Burkholderia multivorans]MBU9496278.1 SGNH/GDSL hydrolase family protein [Burkholderia multivorans]